MPENRQINHIIFLTILQNFDYKYDEEKKTKILRHNKILFQVWWEKHSLYLRKLNRKNISWQSLKINY